MEISLRFITKIIAGGIGLFFLVTFMNGLLHGFNETHEATITSLNGTVATIEWNDYKVQPGGEGKEVLMHATIDISNLDDHDVAQVGDTIDVEVHKPGYTDLLSSIGSGERPQSTVRALDLNLNWVSVAWRNWAN